MGSDFSLASSTTTISILTANPTLTTLIGVYVFHFQICLTNYISVSCATFDSQVEITPCVVTAFTMNAFSTADDKIYTVADQALGWTLATPVSTTQVPACGYNEV